MDGHSVCGMQGYVGLAQLPVMSASDNRAKPMYREVLQ